MADTIFSWIYSDPLCMILQKFQFSGKYRGADKPLARRTSRCILCDDENILFNASHYVYQ